MNTRILAAALGVAIFSGCASQQDFSQSMGDLRISGNLAESASDPQTRTLSLHLADVKTGKPLDASDVEVKAGDAHVVRATRQQPGSYVAQIQNAPRVNLLIVQNGRTATLALQQR
jgi:hypothetical protein